jgi:crotonobetainyl-CoA:carnitine CoA-transferase CaiB-like acyl-CoA transferase
MGPLSGCLVWELAATPAAAFAGRLLALMGADVVMIEPEAGSAVRALPPRTGGHSALFDYLGAGKRSALLSAEMDAQALDGVHVLLHDSLALPDALEEALEGASLPERGRAVVACTPYGLDGPKSGWEASELTLFQVGGEGYLIPHGLPFEEQPDRPPIGMARYIAHYQGGIAAALAAVPALRQSRRIGRAERVDVSIQEAELSLNYFTVSRFVEGVQETRATRAFRYAGLVRCSDGFVELVPLEQHQWEGLRKMLGSPQWAFGAEFEDPIQRAGQGDVINRHLRSWAAAQTVEEVVRKAAENGIPAGPYLAPHELPAVEQMRCRGFFQPVDGDAAMRHFPGSAWVLDRWDKPAYHPAPELGQGEENRHATAGGNSRR